MNLPLELLPFVNRLIMFILTPVAWLWGLNTLFGTEIPFTFSTWIACQAIILPLYTLAENTNKH